jgi:hypothetical protein
MVALFGSRHRRNHRGRFCEAIAPIRQSSRGLSGWASIGLLLRMAFLLRASTTDARFEHHHGVGSVYSGLRDSRVPNVGAPRLGIHSLGGWVSHGVAPCLVASDVRSRAGSATFRVVELAR